MGWYTAQSTYIPIVPQCMSPRPNWDLPPPLPQASVSLPRNQRGGAHSPAGEGVAGGPQFRRLEEKPSTLSTLWFTVQKEHLCTVTT
jgi:hypothetical protein